MSNEVNSIHPEKKCSGLLIPVFTLRRAGDWGIGDTIAVKEALSFCHRLGFRVLQLLPIQETGADHSPYNAISSVALDPVYISMSPEMVPGLTKEMVAKVSARSDFNGLQEGSVIYPRVKSLKQAVLLEAFEVFQKQGRSREFEKFQKEEKNWLTSYSLFRTIVDFYQGNIVWTQWKEEHQSLGSAEQWLLECSDADFWRSRRVFHTYVQWVAATQWKVVRDEADRLGVELMGDIPFGVSRYSADVWAHQNLFDLQWSGGAPPEKFFKSDRFTEQWGQNWGIPLYRWSVHQKEKYRWWSQRVQKTSEIFHLFRIDHVLGFYRIYAFPWSPEKNHEYVDLTESQAKEKTGGDLPGFKPGSDETAELARRNEMEGETRLQMILKSAGSTGVIAEDLGVVPPYVPLSLQRLGIPGFVIPTFIRNSKTQEFLGIDEYPSLSLTTYATHDHAPLRVMYEEMVQRWLGPDGHVGWIEMQRLMRWLGQNDQQPPAKWDSLLHRQFLHRLFSAPSWLAVLMFSDLMGTCERYNLPGTAADSNWSYRLPRSLSEIESAPENQMLWAYLLQLNQETGRLR